MQEGRLPERKIKTLGSASSKTVSPVELTKAARISESSFVNALGCWRVR